MYKEDLLEGLDELLGGNDTYIIKVKSDGTLVIHTKLIETEEGRMISKDEEVDDDDEDDYLSDDLVVY